MRSLVVALALVFGSPAWAVCDSGYTALTASAAVTEATVANVTHGSVAFNAGICYFQSLVRFSTLKENGSATTCKEGAVQVNAATSVSSIAECHASQATFLKTVTTALVLGRKLSFNVTATSLIGYAGGSAITLE